MTPGGNNEGATATILCHYHNTISLTVLYHVAPMDDSRFCILQLVPQEVQASRVVLVLVLVLVLVPPSTAPLGTLIQQLQ